MNLFDLNIKFSNSFNRLNNEEKQLILFLKTNLQKSKILENNYIVECGWNHSCIRDGNFFFNF
jgi:hypothetical protein